LSPTQRENAIRNFSHVLGLPPAHPLVQRTARGSFRHFARFVAESIHAQGWGMEDMQDRVEIRGGEHLDTAAAEGKGVIFISAHMGATEVAAAVAVLKGFRITSVIEPVRPEWLMTCVLVSRERMGITLVPSAGAGIGLIRQLRRGGMVAFAVDAGIDRPDSIPVKFFGRPTPFPEGPARLARLTGAPMVFGVGIRRGSGRYQVTIQPPLESRRDLPAEEGIRAQTQGVASILEDFVRRYPAQWYAFRDMWPDARQG
jgi:KDO2-lipid IV(A) lauroyltransferase